MQPDWEKYQNDINLLKELWEAAHIDNLTGLYNRYGMDQGVLQLLEQMKMNEATAILMIDIDNFKYVNDQFGHMLGDALLLDIANMIKELFGEKKFLCGRIGGDEFHIFGIHVSREEICKKAESLCNRVKEQYEKEHQEYHISLSIGVVFENYKEQYDYNELYKKADIALYQAKEAGKNRYVVFGENMQKKQDNLSERKKQHIEQVGESGFSMTKILLDQVIHILGENEDPQTAIEKIAKLLVETFDVTRAYGSCYTKDGSHIGKSFFYAQNNDPNIKPNLSLSAYEYEKKCYNKDGIFFCTDINKTVEPIKTELKRMRVQTLLQILIYRNGKIIGTLGANNCGYKRLWVQSEIEVMHTIAKLMTNHVYRLQLSLEEEESC